MLNLKKCKLCPRNCGIDRTVSRGFCKAGDSIKIARAALHFWEEPCISGKNGSGTIFFSHCNLVCAYCQNRKISKGGFGKEISCEKLGDIFLALEDKGAHNINLVTPTPYVPLIIKALDAVRHRLTIPIVYNCGGYEKPEIIKILDDYVDIYLTDCKYYSNELSAKYSAAADYCYFAFSSLCEMIKTKGAPVFRDDIIQKGVIVRHLVLPSCRKDSMEILKKLRENFEPSDFVLSLMSQYFPPCTLEKFPELSRKITSFEYNSVTDFALELGFDGAYIQSRESANDDFVPDFNLNGVD